MAKKFVVLALTNAEKFEGPILIEVITDPEVSRTLDVDHGASLPDEPGGDVDGKSGDELIKINNKLTGANDELTFTIYKPNQAAILTLIEHHLIRP